MLQLSILFFTLFVSFVLLVNTIPTVLLHGTLANKAHMDELKNLLEINLKIDVYNIEIGNGVQTSFYTPMEYQLQLLCDEIYKIDVLKDGFNFIGMSQGGLLARGYVEYCNKYPVNNLITLVSPNAGIYFNSFLTINFYQPHQQNTLAVTNYWRDPYNFELYLSNSTYIAKLNEELLSNSNQNDLDIVNNFIMIWSPIDDVIMPPESAKFSLQYINEQNNIASHELVDTYIYKSGRLGLKNLNKKNRLHIFETNCTHVQHKELACFSQLKPIFEQYLL